MPGFGGDFMADGAEEKAESTEDQDVDALIADVQSALDKLKAAQQKDVADEDSEPPAKTLREASVRVREHFRRARQAEQALPQK